MNDKLLILYLIVSGLLNAFLFALVIIKTVDLDDYSTLNFKFILEQLRIIYNEINDIKRRLK